MNELESRRQSLWPLVTPGLSPQPWWASTWQITQTPEKERHLQHGVKTALPEREETWAHLGSGVQIQQGVPASVLSLLGSLRQRKGEVPLVKPWEGRGGVNGCGAVGRRVSWGGGRRRDTYCSWGSGRTASGPVTPCPGSGRGGAPAPAPGLAPGLAPSPGPSPGPGPGPGPGHLQMQTCGADRVLCTPLHTRTLHLLSPGSRGPYRGAVAPTPGPGPAGVAWTHFRGLAQAGLALVRLMPSQGARSCFRLSGCPGSCGLSLQESHPPTLQGLANPGPS